MKLFIDKNIQGQMVTVTDYFLVKVRRITKTKKGKIVGCYLNEYWHPYTYKAFHVEFEDGTRGTFHPKKVRFCV